MIANTNIVPHWATQEQFDQYERDGLMMYGQMTAGSWIYIGTQGILQGTYETFGSLARQHGWGTLAGKLVLTAGLGEMGGAQAQAITFNGGVGLLVEVDPWRIERRLQLKQVDVAAKDLDDAIDYRKRRLSTDKEARSIALLGNAAEVHWQLLERGIIPDVVTDQTSAHDVLYGYIPVGLDRSKRRPNFAKSDPDRIRTAVRWTRCRGTSRRCSNFRSAARSSSITATICGRGQKTTASQTLSTIPDLFRRTSGRYFAKAKARFAGSLCRATKRTSTKPTRRS